MYKLHIPDRVKFTNQGALIVDFIHVIAGFVLFRCDVCAVAGPLLSVCDLCAVAVPVFCG